MNMWIVEPSSVRAVALAAACAALTLTLLSACDRPAAPSDAASAAPPSSPASALSVVAAGSGTHARGMNPFDFEVVGALPDVKEGTEMVLVPVYAADGGQGEGPQRAPLATGRVRNGQLHMQGRSPLPQPVFLYAKGDEYAIDTFLVQEGRIELEQAEGRLRVTNSRYGQAMEARRSQAVKDMQGEIRQMEAALAQKPLKGAERAAAQKKIDALFQKAQAQSNAEEVAFILDTAADPFERLLVLDVNVDEQTLTATKRLAVLDELEQKLGTHPLLSGKKRTLKAELAGLDTQKTMVTGAPFKEVVGVDMDGKQVRLSDMVKRNKVVLLDIWASWCGICREEFPHLKKVYAKYRSQGFEIFAISTDERRKDWIQAMKDDQTTTAWPQLHDGRGQDANVAIDYGVTSYPSKFLITQDGKIVANSNSGKVDLDKLLPALLK